MKLPILKLQCSLARVNLAGIQGLYDFDAIRVRTDKSGIVHVVPRQRLGDGERVCCGLWRLSSKEVPTTTSCGFSLACSGQDSQGAMRLLVTCLHPPLDVLERLTSSGSLQGNAPPRRLLATSWKKLCAR